MKINKKIVSWLSPLVMSSISVLATSCINKTVENKNDIADNWDTNITIVNSWINPGFKSENDKGQSEIEKNFLTLLAQRFNDFKNKDEETKDLPDVNFFIETNQDKDTFYSKLESNNPTLDLMIANYATYLNSFADETGKVNDLHGIKLVSQTSTLKFNWQGSDNDTYSNGLSDDKLRQAADRNNQSWVKNTGYEYPDWQQAVSEKKLSFDGSKFIQFYENNALTYVYHGAIYIAGNKAQRDQIIQDWNNKDWDAFVAHGIAFKKNTSSGGYKYQVALLARHFNKSLREINTYLESDSENIIKGQSIQDTLGKRHSSNIIPLIGFDDEGVYNWTNNAKHDTYFKPEGFVSNQPYDSEDNVVIRTLTLTNPAAYDVVLARTGISQKQTDLISKALNSLSLNENTYGIYTGYNKFQPLDLETFQKFMYLQVQAETKNDKNVSIPEITDARNN
ncbi:ABC transporter thiamine pyrophosphate-binding lipoprotein p37/Cypl [Mycoplasma sp. HS2188]|uniref:ABC transporter thiamine pyrophosphate-binding lipoprotein p37/Cypl n=1 Tax=Mycoplasma sp. HS2188 TaxID=2976765 RepID=UPI0021AAE174|nr:ABC transporter substrate-binding protein [Mycoplasma sp. HS2188]MCT4469449.1 ABC transporter substrate-binding protein [Mycoplasma sp. HS2188]